MTWKAYIDPIRLILINKAKPKIIMELFETAAGRAMEFGESATKRWYYGEKNCDSYKWFPKGEFDKENLKNLYDIFRNRPDNKLEKLQQEFRKTTDRNGPIDLETNDMDIFCWSLVNQFLDLLGFQMIDITEILPDKKTISGNQTSDNEKTTSAEGKATGPEFNTSENSEKKGMPQNETLPESMLSVFYRNSIGFAIDDFISSPVESITPDRIRDIITFIGYIKTKHENKDSPDIKEATYKKIIEFTDILYKYISLLRMNSANSVFPECFELAKDNDDGFKEKARSYLKKLNGLYPKIIAEYENEENEKMDKKRAEHKKIFENIEPGALDELSDSIFS